MEEMMKELKDVCKHFANVLKYNPELLQSGDLELVIELNFSPLVLKAYQKQKDIIVNDLTHLNITGSTDGKN